MASKSDQAREILKERPTIPTDELMALTGIKSRGQVNTIRKKMGCALPHPRKIPARGPGKGPAGGLGEGSKVGAGTRRSKAKRLDPGRVRASDLSEEDRARCLETVVTIQRVIQIEARRMLRTAEAALEGEDNEHLPELDRDRTAALVNLQRTSSGILDQFPGLLQARKGEGADDGDEAIELEAVLQALDLPAMGEEG